MLTKRILAAAALAVLAGSGVAGTSSAADAAPVAPAAATGVAKALPPGGSFVSTPPRRVFDSRQGSGPLREARTDPFAGTTVDRTTVAAVLVNITVVDAAAPGYVWTGGSNGSAPTSTQGNFGRGAPFSTSQLVAYQAANGLTVDVSQPADVVIDLQGWVTTPAAATRDTYTPVAPVRVADSRTGAGLTRFGAGGVQRLDVRGRAGLPDDVEQVVVTLTAVDATASTYVTAWAANRDRPVVSDLNVAAGGPVSNKALVPVSPTGSIALFNAGGRTDLVVDVVGYVSPSPSGSYYTPLFGGLAATPQGTRLLDYTADGITLGATMDFGAGADPDAVHAPSVADLAPTTAVWLSYAAVARQRGYLRVTPGDTTSSTSDAALVPGVASSGAGPVAVSASMGEVTVVASTSSRLVVDLFGWFRRTTTAPANSILTRQTVHHDVQARPNTLPTRLPAAFSHAVGGTDPTTGETTLYAAVSSTEVDRVVWHQEEATFAAEPPQPELVYNASAITSVVSGGGRENPAVYVLHDGGQVFALGSNSSGELGEAPSTLDRHDVALPEAATAVYAADGVGYAVLASGAVYSWGRADTDQLGRNPGNTPWVPAPVVGLTSPRAIAGDGRLTFAIDAAGRTVVWGDPDETGSSMPGPTAHAGCAEANSLEVGTLEIWELCADGTVQLLADADTLPAPVAVAGLRGVVELGPDPNQGVSARLSDGGVAVSLYVSVPARRVGGLVGVTALGGTPEAALFTTG